MLVLVALLLSLASLIAFLPQFYIETVTVTGSRMTDGEVIKTYARSKEGEHFLPEMGGSAVRFLSLRYGGIEEEIKADHPMVRQVRVCFHFPSTIAITVEEKVEILAVRVSGGYALIDRDQEVLRILEETDFALPVLEGVSLLGQAAVGQPLKAEDPSQLTAASHLIAGLIQHDQTEASGPRLMEKIRQIRQIAGPLFFLFIPLSQGGEIRVRLEDNRLLQDKLALLSYLLERGDLIPQTAGELDLSGETAYFRPDTGQGQITGFTEP